MQKRTFTLIEMLIVVVIIGILAAALIPRLQSVQARARDIKRKADLHQIGTALEIYKEDNGNYTSFATAKNNGNSYLRGGVDDTTRTIANKESYDTYYQGWDNITDVYDLLGKYMTSVPTDSDQSARSTRDAPYNDPEIHGYAIVFLNRHSDVRSFCLSRLGTVSCNTSQYLNAGYALNSYILTARTETEGNTNRVTNRTISRPLKNMHGCAYQDSEDFDPQNISPRIGVIAPSPNQCSKSDLYEKFLCAKSTFTGDSARNDGSNNCFINKDTPGMYYLYIN